MARTKQRRTYLPYTLPAIAGTPHLSTPRGGGLSKPRPKGQRATGPRLLRDSPQPADLNPPPSGRWSSALTTRPSRQFGRVISIRQLCWQQRGLSCGKRWELAHWDSIKRNEDDLNQQYWMCHAFLHRLFLANFCFNSFIHVHSLFMLFIVYVVHVVQLKHLSLSIHMMTSQGHICVQCVTNGLHGKRIWMLTERGTLEKTCIHVLDVINVFHLRALSVIIWMFI